MMESPRGLFLCSSMAVMKGLDVGMPAIVVLVPVVLARETGAREMLGGSIVMLSMEGTGSLASIP